MAPGSGPGSGDGLCPRCLFQLADAPSPGAGTGGGGDGWLGYIGHSFGNYEVRDRIGQGGMGVVFRARQRDLGRTVALKMIRSGPLASEAEVARFRVEAQAAAALRHPNIVTIHEVGEVAGQPYFTMDFIEGESLADLVQRSSPAPGRSAEYVRVLAGAIDHAHRQGVLHRDLKPANVLIDAAGQLHITDFGLAKSLTEDVGLTGSGAVMGSPGYSAPEVAGGGGRGAAAGPASDVYSLGAVLYDLLTSRPPFLADTPLETFRLAGEGDLVPPRVLNRRVPRDLEAICLKCLEREPAHRFQSAGELADELGRFTRGEPVQTRPVSAPVRAWRWGRRNPALAGLAALLVLMSALVGLAAFLFRDDILDGNMQEAALTARVIEEQLDELRDEVAAIASDPALPGLLQEFGGSGEPAALGRFLDRHREFATTSGALWLGESEHFHSLSLFDAEGNIVARSPASDQHYEGTYADRDHFAGAMRLGRGGRPHVSLIYDSRTDREAGWRDKFGISLPVGAADGARYVFMASVPTAPSHALSGFSRNAVLIGRRDPTNELRRDSPWLVIAHPALSVESEAIGIARLPIPESAIPGRSGFYFDPASSRHPRFAGPWLAGSARVPGSELVVIVQTRDQVTNALVTTAAVAVLAGAGWFALRALRRGRQRRAEADPAGPHSPGIAGGRLPGGDTGR